MEREHDEQIAYHLEQLAQLADEKYQRGLGRTLLRQTIIINHYDIKHIFEVEDE
jgi:hypothetical protein